MNANPFALDGRVVIVTGGAMGIGEGLVRLLVDCGAVVAIADRDLPKEVCHIHRCTVW